MCTHHISELIWPGEIFKYFKYLGSFNALLFRFDAARKVSQRVCVMGRQSKKIKLVKIKTTVYIPRNTASGKNKILEKNKKSEFL